MIEAFIDVQFHRATLEMIHLVNSIVDNYASQGYTLTLRQLYYQLVARDYIKNHPLAYKRLGEIASNARLAGMIDWDAIEDRTRNLRGVSHHDDPTDILETAASSFRIDKWKDQPHRVEVWVEKDALVGILEKACRPLDVDYFSCRGYTSQSAVYRAAKRFISYFEAGQQPVIIHLGDHDPSGMDMTRDIFDRLEMMVTQQTGHELTVERVALNMDQIVQYHPPPNPAKVTDSRYEEYMRKYGKESWELDSMEPSVIDKLITDTVLKYRDEAQWEKDNATEEKHREQLGSCAHNWAHVSQFVDKPESYLKMDDVMSIERSAGPALKKELHGLLDGGDEKRPVIVYDRGLSIEVPVANFRHILKATRKKKPSKKKPSKPKQ